MDRYRTPAGGRFLFPLDPRPQLSDPRIPAAHGDRARGGGLRFPDGFARRPGFLVTGGAPFGSVANGALGRGVLPPAPVERAPEPGEDDPRPPSVVGENGRVPRAASGDREEV